MRPFVRALFVVVLISTLSASARAGTCQVYYADTDLYHLIGRDTPSAGDWIVDVHRDDRGWMSYGPYDNRWGSGFHRASFALRIDNNTANNDTVAMIDVVTDFGNRVLARRYLKRLDFPKANSLVWFTLGFNNPNHGYLETRIYWYDKAAMTHWISGVCDY